MDTNQAQSPPIYYPPTSYPTPTQKPVDTSGGFWLGFLLGLLGVIIAYAIKTPEKNSTGNAWMGCIVSFVLWIIIFAAAGGGE